MKTKFIYFVFSVFFTVSTFCLSHAQETPLWGTDVNVMPESGKFYKNVVTAVAYDGTVYMGRLVSTSASGPYTAFEILKSTDGGRNWSLFYDESGTETMTALDIIAAGENSTDFRLYVAVGVISGSDAILGAGRLDSSGSLDLLSFTGKTFSAFDSERGWVSLSWATDSRRPNPDSSPYAISLVASVSTPSSDMVYAWTTNKPNDNNFNEREVFSTISYIGSVSAAIGTSEPMSDWGRLGLVYQVNPSVSAEEGALYVRYYYPDDLTEPANTGPYTVGSGTNQFSSPNIAISQVLGSGSGPGFDDFRTLVSYSTSSTGDGSKDVNFRFSDNLLTAAPDFASGVATGIGTGAGDQTNPHMIYDPMYNNFLVTYYDKATGKLPYKIKNLTTAIADPFLDFKDNYRDSPAIPTIDIKPRVDMSIHEGKAVFAWNDETKSMFDAEYFLSVQDQQFSSLMVYPNPVRDILNIKSDRQIDRVEIVNMAGQPVIRAKQLNDGKLQVSQLLPGVYVLNITYNDRKSESVKIVKK